MTSKSLASVTNQLIASYGNTAQNVISAYRVGNERAASYLDYSWANAVQKAGTRLSDEVRTNALAAQKKVSGYYVKGIALTTDSADVAVRKAVELAGKGVEQVSANASRFEQSTGLTTLSTLAVAAIPAAQAVIKVATQIEAQSGVLLNKVAGSKAKVVVAKVKRTVARKTPRARKAA